jgi:hypothetical protein
MAPFIGINNSKLPPDVRIWASIFKDEELLGKSSGRVAWVNKELKFDRLHLVRISTFCLNLLQLGHNRDWRVLMHSWKHLF